MAKLFVIAGHGAGDPGACGNGYSEAERVRALAARIKALGGVYVTVGDTSRNWYRDNGISKLNLSREWQIIELHMDAGAAGAKGGHVIIKSGFKADAYDNALASFIGSILPGRANKIVGRSDLANVNRAAAKGIGYRLVEFGFITNAGDVGIFNSRMDDIARGVLNAFGITGKSATGNTNTGKSSAPSRPSGGEYTGNSIVDYLNSKGIDSSFANRKKLAAQYGISGYAGTATQNLTLLNKMRGGQVVSAGTSYYKAFNSSSIVDGLKSIGIDSSMANRKKIAAANGIAGYSGTTSQNTKLCNLAKQGKLKKA